MKKNSMPAASGRRVHGRMGIVLAAALVFGLLQPSNGSIYAAPVSNRAGAGTENRSTDTALPPDDADMMQTPDQGNETSPESGNGESLPAPDSGNGGGAPAPDNRNEEVSPTPEGEAADVTPTPEDGNGEPVPTPEGENTEAAPTPEGENTEAAPTPDGEDMEATPTPEDIDGEPSPTPDTGKEEPAPTPEGGDGDVSPAPTPTKGPELPEIPTPVPTGEPDITEVPEVPEVSPEPTEPPAPTPQYKVDIPWETNDDRYQYLFGMDAREITMSTPPKGYENKNAAASHMVTITVPVWKMRANGKKYSSTYKLTVNKKLSQSVKAIFKEIYALDMKFPIKQLNGFYYRKVGGSGLSNSTLMSVHSFGAAIDINPGDFDNDYFLGKGNDLRDKSNPYCIPDEVIEIFAKYHWFWGGNFEICADTMHFQYLGLEMLHYQNNPPFRDLKVKSGYMKGTDVRNLQQRLCELGYKVTIDGVYGSRTAAAVKKYQKDRGLPADGQVNYKTWETIINETHYMAYAF